MKCTENYSIERQSFGPFPIVVVVVVVVVVHISLVTNFMLFIPACDSYPL